METTVKAFGDRIGDLGKGVDQAAAAAQKADRQAALASEEAAQTRTEQEADKALRLAVVAAALREHTTRGTPFAAELSAAKPLADPELLKPLEPFADVRRSHRGRARARPCRHHAGDAGAAAVARSATVRSASGCSAAPSGWCACGRSMPRRATIPRR